MLGLLVSAAGMAGSVGVGGWLGGRGDVRVCFAVCKGRWGSMRWLVDGWGDGWMPRNSVLGVSCRKDTRRAAMDRSIDGLIN